MTNAHGTRTVPWLPATRYKEGYPPLSLAARGNAQACGAHTTRFLCRGPLIFCAVGFPKRHIAPCREYVWCISLNSEKSKQ